MTQDTEKLRTIGAVALDVDGTIAGTDHHVSDRTAAAIRSILNEGLPVYLLTGRSRRSVLALARELGIDNQVAAANGSVSFNPVTDTDTRTVPMKPEDIRKIVELHRKHGLAITWWTRDLIWVDALGAITEQLIELNEDETDIRVGSVDDIDPAKTVKMMLHGKPEQLDAVASAIRAVLPEAARSMDVFYEFVHPEANKWAALQHLLGGAIAPADVLGIGDGGNDVPWLRRIGYAVAMANARVEVASIARAHTGHHGDDGAAQTLERLLHARREHHSTER